MKRLKLILPFVILFALLFVLWRELFFAKPNEIPSALIGQTVPNFQLPNLFAPQIKFTQENLRGRVSLLNVWATWCYACSMEQPMLMKIKDQYHIPIYSIDYKDDPNNAKTWLRDNGNPYLITGSDHSGDVAIDFGVYGTPETFVINKEGRIVYRHVGAIDQEAWDNALYPLIKTLDGAK